MEYFRELEISLQVQMTERVSLNTFLRRNEMNRNSTGEDIRTRLRKIANINSPESVQDLQTLLEKNPHIQYSAMLTSILCLCLKNNNTKVTRFLAKHLDMPMDLIIPLQRRMPNAGPIEHCNLYRELDVIRKENIAFQAQKAEEQANVIIRTMTPLFAMQLHGKGHLKRIPLELLFEFQEHLTDNESVKQLLKDKQKPQAT